MRKFTKLNSEIGKHLRWCFGLSFLDPLEVEDCFVEDLMSEAPAEIHNFCDYLLDNYILNNSKFPPCMWASNISTVERTTNACESFYEKFGKNFYTHSPHIFIFVHELLELQEEVLIFIRSDEPKIYSKAIIQKQASLELNLLKYREGDITRYIFIKNVSKYYSN